MKKSKISDSFFYKYRYIIGYGILFLGYLAIIFYSLFVAPNSLTQAEMNSAVDSVGMSIGDIFSSQIINAPYKILQKVSIYFLGLTNFSIKLPSILISAFSIYFIIKLTNIWFNKGTATLASIIAITSSQFFFLAQNGSPDILYIFYPIMLLFFGAKFITSKKKAIYGAALMGISALSFYTPLSVYILIAFILTVLTHPHLRFTLKRTKKNRLIFGGIIFTLILLPLFVAIFKDISVVKIILGIPNSFDVFLNLKRLMNDLFGFTSVGSNGSLSPIIGFSTLILIGIGLYFTYSEKYSAKSYMINIWTVILLLVCIVNPKMSTILFTPIFLLTVSGLQSLLQSWYTLFPLNPYARIGGLIPVVFLVSGMLVANIDNFRLSYTYQPSLLSSFNSDLSLLNTLPNDRKYEINVTEDNIRFYDIWSKKRPSIDSNEKPAIIVSGEKKQDLKIPKNYELEKILVSDRKENADRFYIYKLK